jgi:tRNA G26 N,N-dimethylase Trm1
MVEIFKTDVYDVMQAEQIVSLLNQHFPAFMINFDLHDCDKILRVKGESIPVNEIVDIVSSNGFHCSVLD